jgi:hypothetical protein
MNNKSTTDHMFPFVFLKRSAAARKALEPMKVRIWEARAWGFWKPYSLGYTKNPLDAEVFDFGKAWEIAHAYGSPAELLFDPVNDPVQEPHEDFKSRWKDLLKRFQDEAGTDLC